MLSVSFLGCFDGFGFVDRRNLQCLLDARTVCSLVRDLVPYLTQQTERHNDGRHNDGQFRNFRESVSPNKKFRAPRSVGSLGIIRWKCDWCARGYHNPHPGLPERLVLSAGRG